MIDFKNDPELNILNHSCAHVMAQAIKHLYPHAKFWVGPVVSEGFYYDVDLGNNVIKDEDIAKIEKEMKKICKDGKRIVRHEISREEALEMFKNDEYKLDLISNLEDETISCYSQGDFIDLCRGPHVETVKKCKNFKLTKHSGAYWKGDSSNKMLQRIYGVCFNSAEDLDEYLNMVEEAKKRDHRKLGRDMDLFLFDESAPGMPYWLPKGLTLFNKLIAFWRSEHKKRGYQEFSAPQLNHSQLWKISGHWDHYKDDMFVFKDSDGNEQGLKPMSCPNAIIVYKSKIRSYRDLPLRFSDVDVIHRDEAAGALHGLLRVRMFRQDDSHNFVRQDQIADEISKIFDIADYFYKIFDLKYRMVLSTRPEDFMGDINIWNEAESNLKSILEMKFGKDGFEINEGDGAFYGPKIDILMEDSLGRKWQMGTIQLDFQLPLRFDLSYINQNGEKDVPVIIHRTIYGSLERFTGLLIENFGGALPLWLSPIQVKVIPVNIDYHIDYCNQIIKDLQQNNIDVESDYRNEKMGYKIREAQKNKIPITIIIGDGEINNQTISYRRYGEKDTVTVGYKEFIDMINNEVENKIIHKIQ